MTGHRVLEDTVASRWSVQAVRNLKSDLHPDSISFSWSAPGDYLVTRSATYLFLLNNCRVHFSAGGAAT